MKMADESKQNVKKKLLFHDITFFMRPCKERQEIRPLIESEGGKVTSKLTTECIKLAEKGSLVSREGYISTDFIQDCIKQRKLLSTDNYSIKPGTTVRTESMRSTSTDDSFEHASVIIKTSSKDCKGRTKYTKEEDIAIMTYLIEEIRYQDAGGKRVWKDMELLKITNHTSESMGTRYRKIILPNLDRYKNDIERSWMSRLRGYVQKEKEFSSDALFPPTKKRPLQFTTSSTSEGKKHKQDHDGEQSENGTEHTTELEDIASDLPKQKLKSAKDNVDNGGSKKDNKHVKDDDKRSANKTSKEKPIGPQIIKLGDKRLASAKKLTNKEKPTGPQTIKLGDRSLASENNVKDDDNRSAKNLPNKEKPTWPQIIKLGDGRLAVENNENNIDDLVADIDTCETAKTVKGVKRICAFEKSLNTEQKKKFIEKFGKDLQKAVELQFERLKERHESVEPCEEAVKLNTGDKISMETSESDREMINETNTGKNTTKGDCAVNAESVAPCKEAVIANTGETIIIDTSESNKERTSTSKMTTNGDCAVDDVASGQQSPLSDETIDSFDDMLQSYLENGKDSKNGKKSDNGKVPKNGKDSENGKDPKNGKDSENGKGPDNKIASKDSNNGSSMERSRRKRRSGSLEEKDTHGKKVSKKKNGDNDEKLGNGSLVQDSCDQRGMKRSTLTAGPTNDNAHTHVDLSVSDVERETQGEESDGDDTQGHSHGDNTRGRSHGDDTQNRSQEQSQEVDTSHEDTGNSAVQEVITTCQAIAADFGLDAGYVKELLYSFSGDVNQAVQWIKFGPFLIEGFPWTDSDDEELGKGDLNGLVSKFGKSSVNARLFFLEGL